MLKIVDNDLSLAFSAPAYSVKESAGSAIITVELAGVNATPVTVAWATSDGTATAGADYGVLGAGPHRRRRPPPSGTLTFPPGGTPTTVRTKTFAVRILQDRLIEATETVEPDAERAHRRRAAHRSAVIPRCCRSWTTTPAARCSSRPPPTPWGRPPATPRSSSPAPAARRAARRSTTPRATAPAWRAPTTRRRPAPRSSPSGRPR